MIYPKSIASLIEHFQKFPSVGPKSAQRMAFYMLRMPESEVQKFAQAILDAKRVCEKLGIKHYTVDFQKEFDTNVVKPFIKEYQECAIFTKKHPKVLLESFLILFCQRLSILSISYIIYLSFGLNELSFLEVLAFQVCITLGSDFVPFPGGVVVSEGLLLQANQIVYGTSLATSAMILLRGISFYLLVIVAFIFYLFFHFIKRKKAQKIGFLERFFS